MTLKKNSPNHWKRNGTSISPITDNLKVGIGIVPNYNLDVLAGVNDYAVNIYNNHVGGAGRGILVTSQNTISQRWERNLTGTAGYLELSFPSQNTNFNSYQDIIFQQQGTQRMRIDNTNGYVALGPHVPVYPLHIYQPAADAATVIQRISQSYQAYIGVGTTGTGTTPDNPFWSFGLQSGSGSFNIQNYNGSTLTTNLRIDTNGYVGIGTTSIDSTLHVESNPTGNIAHFHNTGTGIGKKGVLIETSSGNSGDYGLQVNSFTGGISLHTSPNGNVAIGTTPYSTFKFTINGEGNALISSTNIGSAPTSDRGQAIVAHAATSTTGAYIQSWHSNVTANGRKKMHITANGRLLVQNADGGQIHIGTNGANGTTASPLYPTLNFLGYVDKVMGQIKVSEKQGSVFQSNLIFSVRDSADTLQQVLDIDGGTGHWVTPGDLQLDCGSDGTLELVDTVWNDSKSTLSTQPVVNPNARLKFDYVEQDLEYADNCTLDEYAVVTVQISHEYKEGTDLLPHLHWFQSASGVPNWLLQYRIQKLGDTKSTSWTSTAYTTGEEFTYTSGTLNQISVFPSISGTGVQISDIIQFRIIRDTNNDSGLFAGTDPVTGDTHAVSFDFHFEIDTMGSRQEFIK